MKAPSADAKLDTVGELSISGGDFQIKATATKPKTPISVSNGGRTLTLGVPKVGYRRHGHDYYHGATHATTEGCQLRYGAS